MNQFFALGGQSIGASASVSVLPMNIQDSFPLGLIFWISLQSKGLKNLLQHHSSRASFLWPSTFSQESSPIPQFKSINSLALNFLSRIFSKTTVQKHQFFGPQLSLRFNSHPYMTTGKNIAVTEGTFAAKVTCLLFSMLSRFVIDFLPRRKHHLISWLQSPSAVILEPKKIVYHCSIVSPSICLEVMGLDTMIFFFFFLEC